MWNTEKKNIFVFLTERCKELEQLRAELADDVAHSRAPDIEGLQTWSRNSRVSGSSMDGAWSCATS